MLDKLLDVCASVYSIKFNGIHLVFVIIKWIMHVQCLEQNLALSKPSINVSNYCCYCYYIRNYYLFPICESPDSAGIWSEIRSSLLPKIGYWIALLTEKLCFMLSQKNMLPWNFHPLDTLLSIRAVQKMVTSLLPSIPLYIQMAASPSLKLLFCLVNSSSDDLTKAVPSTWHFVKLYHTPLVSLSVHRIMLPPPSF